MKTGQAGGTHPHDMEHLELPGAGQGRKEPPQSFPQEPSPPTP